MANLTLIAEVLNHNGSFSTFRFLTVTNEQPIETAQRLFTKGTVQRVFPLPTEFREQEKYNIYLDY